MEKKTTFCNADDVLQSFARKNPLLLTKANVRTALTMARDAGRFVLGRLHRKNNASARRTMVLSRFKR